MRTIIKRLHESCFHKRSNKYSYYILTIRLSSIKTTKKIHVPRARLIFLLGYIVKVICPIVEHLGDDEGAFPSRSALVRPLLIHSENEVSFLKCSTSDVSGMESMKVLLVNG